MISKLFKLLVLCSGLAQWGSVFDWMHRSAVGAAAARQGPSADGFGAGLDRHGPWVAPPASPGSRAGCAGQDSRGLSGVGGRAGSSGQDEQLGVRGWAVSRSRVVVAPCEALAGCVAHCDCSGVAD